MSDKRFAYIDYQILSERVDPLVLSSAIGSDCYRDSDPIGLAYKVYEKPGQFKYKWIVEWMNMDELRSLRDGCQFILDHRQDREDKEDESSE